MHLTPIELLRRGRSAWRRRAASGGLVLAYHRVTTLDRDPLRLATSPRHFAAQLEMIRRDGVPMTLAAMIDAAKTKTLPPRAVAVTFDDGYADNLHEALPLLERYEVPATIFLTTSALDSGREFWWDELEQVLLHEHGNPRWTIEHAIPSDRHRAYHDLSLRLRVASPAVRDRAVRALAAQHGVRLQMRSTHRPLTREETRTLAASPLISIGSHACSHVALSTLAPADQAREIDEARRTLEQLIRRAVTHLAYPYGGPAEVSRQVGQVAREAGITIGCTTEPGCVGPDTDPLHVPRLLMRDWSGSEFARHWGEWAA